MLETTPGIKNEGKDDYAKAAAVAQHFRKLLFDAKAPELDPGLEKVEDVRKLHDHVLELRRHLDEFARGDFSRDIIIRGVMAGRMKSLQANLLHLIWQMQQVERGDFTQRVDFMGGFAYAFNSMVMQLDAALTSLKEKEEELSRLAAELASEVEKRGDALTVLRKSEENFKYLAEHDPLTGIPNRRSFMARAEIELAQSSIMTKGCSLALLDVDHFKLFNDTYGHMNGDIALRHIADLGRTALRAGDIMARYGGEEFVFFFPEAGEKQGLMACERIRVLIADNPVKLLKQAVPVTVSIGVVTIPPDDCRMESKSLLESAISLADSALYQAKANGRNQVQLGSFTCNFRP